MILTTLWLSAQTALAAGGGGEPSLSWPTPGNNGNNGLVGQPYNGKPFLLHAS